MTLRNTIFCLLVFALIMNACSKKEGTNPPNPPAAVCATNTAPANGSIVASSTVTLGWSPVANATGYNIYVGSNLSPVTRVAQNISGTTYLYTLPSSVGQTYTWYAEPIVSGNTPANCQLNAISFTYSTIQAPTPFGYYVVGYFPSYRNPADVPDVKFRMTNVVVYAFFEVNTSGTLDVINPSTLAAVITKARANNAKIFVGINDGSGDGKTNFKNMAANATGRNNFIKEVMNKVRQYGFDGVDMDWEFPSTSDGTDGTFTSLMKELSDSLHLGARYYLSAAITAGKYAGSIRDAIRSEIFPYVDFFNVMAYDDFNTTVPYRQHSDYTLAQTCLNYWLTTRGMPAAKCVLGLPAYGRPSGITQTGTVLTYKSILAQGGNPQYDSAVVTAGGFTNYTIYYNGQYTVKRKAKLAKDIANGVMLWEKWQDAVDGNSLLKAACDTVGRTY
ncbi:MAG TPA: glycoside hydrolase family 18 protein [Chitinophagaceae bacterium]|jgi:GH18 family chitinase|nr:glycoside hydrolase family 18 protein [Chitinophagaceae bacterium]